MADVAISGIPITDEDAAFGEVAEIFDEIKRVMEIPFVPNLMRTVAASPSALAGTWGALHNVFLRASLPTSLAAMILFSIAASRNCQYCSAVHKVTCKTLGIDETTLSALDGDLAALSPRRVNAIVNFAIKCSADPQGLVGSDYDDVREQGLSDEEIMEVISLAALGNYLDTLADATKIDVDSVFTEALQD